MASIRTLIFGAGLPAVALFLAGCVVLPGWIADRATQHFSGQEGTRMPIAVKVGADGLGFEWWGVPRTLEADAYLGSADTPGTPEHPEFPLSVHFIRVEPTGVLMETVSRDDHAELTSRYLVQGRRIVPVSQRSFGILDKVLAAIIGAGFASTFVSYRRRRARRAD